MFECADIVFNMTVFIPHMLKRKCGDIKSQSASTSAIYNRCNAQTAIVRFCSAIRWVIYAAENMILFEES